MQLQQITVGFYIFAQTMSCDELASYLYDSKHKYYSRTALYKVIFANMQPPVLSVVRVIFNSLLRTLEGCISC